MIQHQEMLKGKKNQLLEQAENKELHMENNMEDEKGDNPEQQQQQTYHPEELKGDGKRNQHEDLHVDDTVELLGM